MSSEFLNLYKIFKDIKVIQSPSDVLIFVHPLFHRLVGFQCGLLCAPLGALDQLLRLVSQLLGRFLAVNCLGWSRRKVWGWNMMEPLQLQHAATKVRKVWHIWHVSLWRHETKLIDSSTNPCHESVISLKPSKAQIDWDAKPPVASTPRYVRFRVLRLHVWHFVLLVFADVHGKMVAGCGCWECHCGLPCRRCDLQRSPGCVKWCGDTIRPPTMPGFSVEYHGVVLPTCLTGSDRKTEH